MTHGRGRYERRLATGTPGPRCRNAPEAALGDRDTPRGGTWSRPPTRVLDVLASSGLGTALRLETLHGLSGSAVFRVRFARRSVVVKVTSARTEFDFYRITAPALRARGIGIPELISGGTLPDGYWFALEHIPKPLPSARWIADGEQMRTLRRLHRTTLEPPHIGGATFRPE